MFRTTNQNIVGGSIKYSNITIIEVPYQWIVLLNYLWSALQYYVWKDFTQYG